MVILVVCQHSAIVSAKFRAKSTLILNICVNGAE